MMKLSARLKWVGTFFCFVAEVFWVVSLYDAYHAPLYAGALETKRVAQRYVLAPILTGWVIWCFLSEIPLLWKKIALYFTTLINLFIFFYELTVVRSDCLGLTGVSDYTYPLCVDRRYPDVVGYDPAWVAYLIGFGLFLLGGCSYDILVKGLLHDQFQQSECEELEKVCKELDDPKEKESLKVE